MSRQRSFALVLGALVGALTATSNSRAASFFLDDPQVSVSGNLAPAGSNFVVDSMWGLADSSAWVWNSVQAGHEFLIAGTNGSGTNENTAANPATIDLSLGDGTYSNVGFLVLSHGFHSTVPPTASVGLVAEGGLPSIVAKSFTGTPDIQDGTQRYYWVTLPDAYQVNDGSLTLSFGDATSVNPAWYTIGRVEADFTPIPEPSAAILIGLSAAAVLWRARGESR